MQSTSLVDGSGALLLCGSYPAAPHTGARFQPGSNRASLHNSFQATSFQGDLAANDLDDMYDDDAGDAAWGGGEDEYGDGNDCGGDDLVADSFPRTETSAPMVMGTPAKKLPSAVLTGSGDKINLASKRRSAPLKDMYAQLDPHQAVTTSREARRGKTYKIPLSLTKPPDNPSAPSLDHLYADIKVSNTSAFLLSGKVPSKGLFDTSLLPILQLKRKQVRQKRLVDARAVRAASLVTSVYDNKDGRIVEGFELYQNLQANAAANTSRVEELWSQDYADYGDDGGDDYGGGGGDGGDDDFGGPESNQRGDGGDLGAGEILTARAEEGAAGSDWADETEEEALARRVANVLNEELNQSNRSSYESICQKYIDNFNQGAHLFAK